MSIGISSFGPEFDTPAEVIHAADRALYIAKSRGKNCIEGVEPKKVEDEEPETDEPGGKKKG